MENKQIQDVVTRRVETPIGPLWLQAGPAGLCACQWSEPAGDVLSLSAPSAESLSWLDRAEQQLAAYFGGRSASFSLPLIGAATPFTVSVWRVLQTIPPATTISYSLLARRVGNPSAVRAVAQACRRNPFAVIVPCHRVVGADGSLTGYAGGTARKAALLALEQQFYAPV